MKPHITIFFTNGATARFEDVTDVVRNEAWVQFNYVSASDGRKKTAVVKSDSVAIVTSTVEVA